MTSDALFGPDGTQLPEPAPVLPDPLVGAGATAAPDRYGPASPQLPSMPLPAGVDPAAMHEAIRAALGDEPASHRPAPEPTRTQPTQPTQPTQSPQATQPARLSQPAQPYIESMRTPPSGIPAQPGYPPPAAQRPGVPQSAQRPGIPPEVQRRAAAVQRARQAAGDPLTEPRRGPSGGGWIGCVVLLIFIAIVVYNLISSLVDAITGG